MRVDRRYLDVIRKLTWEPRHLVLLQHEDENVVYACQPGMSAWLTTPTSPEDSKIASMRCVAVDVRLGLPFSGDWFTWNDLLLYSHPCCRQRAREEIHTFKEFDGKPLDRETLRHWLDQQSPFVSLTSLHSVERYGNPFACVFLAPFKNLVPLIDDAGSIRTVFIPDERVEVFGFSLTFSGNVCVSCATSCVLRYPPILDEEPQDVLE